MTFAPTPMPTVLGHVDVLGYLKKVEGEVIGRLKTDAKDRTYGANYSFEEVDGDEVVVWRTNGRGDRVVLPSRIPLDEELVAFFGLYSGDGAKGSESQEDRGRIKAIISFSQREPNLVRFAVDQFRKVFPGELRLIFSLGEDAAYFMAGEGAELLRRHYGGKFPRLGALAKVRPEIDEKDEQYLNEKRDVEGTNEEHLAFYYQHKEAMEEILTSVKALDLQVAGIELGSGDRVTASLRRPFKKGAREPGGSSRADEIHVGGVNGMGELFLKMLYELEESLVSDLQVSPLGLIRWNDVPSALGLEVDVAEFFRAEAYGAIAGERPKIERIGLELMGKWPRSKQIALKPKLRIDPLFLYAGGLYLAEGGTPKSELFAMFSRRPNGVSIGFTSSEDTSLSVILIVLQRLFRRQDVLSGWKIKVGSQYFPELVVIGMKSGVPMLRGGKSGDGKMRTMEISLSLKQWALEAYPSLVPFSDRYSHVEPTGAGVARIDFWASSTVARWLFPLMMFAVFRHRVPAPDRGFVV